MFRYVTSSFLDAARIKHPERTVPQRADGAIPTADAVASGPLGGAEARGIRRDVFRYGERKGNKVSCQNIRDELRRWTRQRLISRRSEEVRLRHSVGRAMRFARAHARNDVSASLFLLRLFVARAVEVGPRRETARLNAEREVEEPELRSRPEI